VTSRASKKNLKTAKSFCYKNNNENKFQGELPQNKFTMTGRGNLSIYFVNDSLSANNVIASFTKLRNYRSFCPGTYIQGLNKAVKKGVNYIHPDRYKY
jgi:hypothetical protein